jgi:adenylate cyclase
MDRKYAAILSADVVGYSRHIHEAEEPTVSRLHDYLSIVTQRVESHRGRIFGGAGDSIIAEFVSPVEAVRCAIDVQRDIASENAKIDDQHRMKFRIGVHSGDVLIDGQNLQGEAVNIAARIQALAQPGGILVSDDAYRHAHRTLKVPFDDHGERRLKNIPEPIRVYSVGVAPATWPGRQLSRLLKPHGIPRTAGLLALSLAAAGAIYLSMWPTAWKSVLWPKSGSDEERPSIAVLPFKSISSTPNDDYFSDGLTQDITGELGRFKHLYVTASNSSFTYKGKSAKAQDIGRDLGVSYLLEGTIQRDADRIRLTAQLVDANTGWQVWTDRYDREGRDIFDIQDRIIKAVVNQLNFEVNAAEIAKITENPTDNPSAYDFYLKGRKTFYDYTKEGFDEAKRDFSEAIRLDPHFAQAYGWLGYVYLAEVQEGYTTDTNQNFALALQLASKGVELAPDDYYTHWNLASVYAGRSEMDRASEEYGKALDLNSNDADLLAEMSDMLSYQGRAGQAIEQIRRAKELNPKYPDWYDWSLGFAYFQNRQYAEALASLQKMADPPNSAYLLIVACKAKLKQMTSKEEIMKHLLQKDPQWTPDHLNEFPFTKPEDKEHYLDAMKAAGVPIPTK